MIPSLQDLLLHVVKFENVFCGNGRSLACTDMIWAGQVLRHMRNEVKEFPECFAYRKVEFEVTVGVVDVKFCSFPHKSRKW